MNYLKMFQQAGATTSENIEATQNLRKALSNPKYSWIVMKLMNPETKEVELGGVYSNKELALQNCHTEDYFISRIEIDAPAIDESYPMECAWYPHLEPEPSTLNVSLNDWILPDYAEIKQKFLQQHKTTSHLQMASIEGWTQTSAAEENKDYNKPYSYLWYGFFLGLLIATILGMFVFLFNQ
jgi:hypothetical protein